MIKQLELVKEFHKKFNTPILDEPSNIPADRFEFRHRLMDGEVQEYLEGARKGDILNVAKELSDILYAVYGTILEHGLQDNFEEIFEEVHKSNMSKDYHQYKMIKGENYFEPEIEELVNR